MTLRQRSARRRRRIVAHRTTSFADADAWDLEFWQRQTPEARLSALVAIRDDIGRIQPAGSPARFEDRVGDNHHHLICRRCGQAVDVECAIGSTPCLTAADDKGYEIDSAEVIYWGLCPGCSAAQAP